MQSNGKGTKPAAEVSKVNGGFVPTEPMSTTAREMLHIDDLQELKRNVGVAPFAQRRQLDSKGFSACPFHDGDSDMSFHVTVKDGVAIGTCFSECGKSFDAISFVSKFDNVSTDEAIHTLSKMPKDGSYITSIPLREKKPAKPMTPEQWLKSGRAVTKEDVQTLAASRPNSATPSAETLNAMGFKIAVTSNGGYLVAPYRFADTFYTLKMRKLDGKEFRQGNCVSQRGLFNIDAVKVGEDVFVVESELDAGVLHENGYVAVSVVNAAQKKYELEVLKKLKTASRIFLVGDQDAAGQDCMNFLSKLLPTEKVYRINFNDAKDIGELAHAGQNVFGPGFEQLKNTALQSWVSKNIPFASTLSAEPVKWAIDRILPLGGLTLISGKYGAQKSLLAFFMSGGLESGTQIFGRKVLQKIPVLYIDRENPENTVGERRAKLGIPEGVIRYWGDWSDERTPNLDDQRLEEFMARENGIIVFDSLTDWLEGANENDPSEMTAVMHNFRRLARRGAGVIVLHHADKYRSGFRGTTAIPAGTDMAIKVSKTDDGLLQLREERFRMCSSWEMDIRFHFGEQYTVEILRDGSPSERISQIRQYLREHEGCSGNDVFKAMGGTRGEVLATVKAIKQESL